jgi:clan AA aspartic protease (TIGR02281 family)
MTVTLSQAQRMGAYARNALIAILLTFSLLPIRASSQESLPDATTILAKVRTASALPAMYHQTAISTLSNGLTITAKRAERGADWHEIDERGPFHLESGRIKGQAWRQNDNGITINEEPDPGNAARDVITTLVTHVTSPVDALVISQLNSRGAGTKRYIDPTTWQIVRIERLTANGNTITTYDDFREDSGHVFSHHSLTKSEVTRTTTESRITTFDVAPVTDGELAIPESRRQVVEFPAGVQSVDLPAQFGRGHVFIHTTINGRGLDFILDSGASGITLDNTVAKEMGLTEIGEQSAVTAQRYTTARTIIPEIRIGTLAMHNIAVQLIPFTTQEMGLKGIGLLGFDFLAQLGVTIDYEHERVTVVPEPRYIEPTEPHAIALDARVGNGVPLVDITINGALGERFIVDTGGAGTLLIFDAFARKHADVLIDQGGGAGRNMTMYGVGGGVSTRPVQLNSILIGSVDLNGFVAHLVTSRESYAGNEDGIIAPEFLRMFTVGLDYAKSRVYLVPNASGRRSLGIRD